MPNLKALFKLSPALAIKYFKNKKNKFTWDWYELWQDAHQKSFTVAKAMREGILNDIRASLDKALSEGKTFRDFQKELKPTLQKNMPLKPFGFQGLSDQGELYYQVQHFAKKNRSSYKSLVE